MRAKMLVKFRKRVRSWTRVVFKEKKNGFVSGPMSQLQRNLPSYEECGRRRVLQEVSPQSQLHRSDQ